MQGRSNEAYGPFQTPVRGPLTSPCTNQNAVFIMCTESDLMLCTGLQLQPTVCYVNVDCSHYSLFTQNAFFRALFFANCLISAS